jgi:uncharacterized YccA/Bax inhibitor family protein
MALTLVPAIGMLGISSSGYCCIQTAILPLFSSGYALFEGLFIGGVSAIFEAKYPGIVTQAVGATFVTFAVCLGLYI